MPKPGCGCSDPLSQASRYHNVRNHDNVIYATKMDRCFSVKTDNELVRGHEGDYLVMSEISGKRWVIPFFEWANNWVECK